MFFFEFHGLLSEHVSNFLLDQALNPLLEIKYVSVLPASLGPYFDAGLLKQSKLTLIVGDHVAIEVDFHIQKWKLARQICYLLTLVVLH